MSHKLLLIDDEAEMTDIAGTYLRYNGYEVETCNEPHLALARLEAEPFDAVVVDLMMFPVDGITIVRGLREMAAYAQRPLFVISAKSVSDEERKELMSLRVHFLPKPFHPRRLLDKLREVLGGA